MIQQPIEHVQTLSQIRGLLHSAGLRPRHRLGQNFLIDGNLMRILVQEARIEPDQTVLEVGCGTGALTALLAVRARRVVAVEVDGALLAIARGQVPADNVTWISGDVLNGPHRLSDSLETALASAETGPWSLVANLPYQIASPLVVVLACRRRPPGSLTFMVQAEVADRILATPGTGSYGPLSVIVQSLCRGDRVRDVPASAFWPQPRIGSTIVHLIADPQRRAAAGDVHVLQWLTRLLFSSRRKTLRATLKRSDLAEFAGKAVESSLRAAGIDRARRAEQLSVEEFAAVAKEISHCGLRIEEATEAQSHRGCLFSGS